MISRTVFITCCRKRNVDAVIDPFENIGLALKGVGRFWRYVIRLIAILSFPLYLTIRYVQLTIGIRYCKRQSNAIAKGDSISMLFSAFNRRIITIIKSASIDFIEQQDAHLTAYEEKDSSMLLHVFTENVLQLMLQSYIVIHSWTSLGEKKLELQQSMFYSYYSVCENSLT